MKSTNSPVCKQCDCVAGCQANPEPCPIWLAECIASDQASAEQIEAHRAAGEVASNAVRPLCQHRFMYFGDQKRKRCADCNSLEPVQPPTAQPQQRAAMPEFRVFRYGMACGTFVSRKGGIGMFPLISKSDVEAVWPKGAI